ncbi:hypothetical protein [Polyangium aurulentum]|uniref:hypothetical protein n=1 Tax=Polyangium aurulentum TaxID=2567896 RepID=UPI00146E90BE|nr:hypothetical protein [Polyangium aurulentum]UQA56661.1 hypothetical protein E8A73_035955 [Polyangium aurulentum]
MNVRAWLAAVALLVVGVVSAVGCESYEVQEESRCNEDPWMCGEGRTCWVNASGTAFTCLNAGPKKIGESCNARTGEPECDEGLMCFQPASGEGSGTCVQNCDVEDPEHRCDGLVCRGAQLPVNGELRVVQVCLE